MSEASESFYSLSAVKNNGQVEPLSKYKGRVTLVVNTASKCGYTSQYKALQAVHEKFHGRGFDVLGFPSNDFGAQEPGTDNEIKTFCEINYGVKFPLFKKDAVKGDAKQIAFKYLTEKGPAKTNGEIKWNFTKFLVNKKGEVVARFESKEKPDSAEVVAQIEKLLAEK